MSPEKRQRLVFFALALLLHGIVFWLVCHLVIFQAPLAPQEDASFTRISIPAKPVPPPEAPAESGDPAMPTVSLTPAPEVMAPIVTSSTSTFSLPKIDMPKIEMPKFPAIPTSTTPGNGSSTGGQGEGAETGNGAPSTGNPGDLEAALKSDTRPGETMGQFFPWGHAFSDAAPMDEIVTKVPEMTSHGSIPRGKGWIYHPENFGRSGGGGGTSFLLHQSRFLLAELLAHSKIKIKTLVLVCNFHDPPSDGQTDAQNLIATLKANNIRLCIISFEAQPYPAIADYVKTSGGVVLYPYGVPPDQVANQLNHQVALPGEP